MLRPRIRRAGNRAISESACVEENYAFRGFLTCSWISDSRWRRPRGGTSRPSMGREETDPHMPKVAQGSPYTTLRRLNTSARSTVSRLPPASTGNHRPDPDHHRLSVVPHAARDGRARRLSSRFLTRLSRLSRFVRLV